MPEILSYCPFCNNYPFIRRIDKDTDTLFWVECRKCGAQGGASKNKIASVELWEQRASIEPKETRFFTLNDALRWRGDAIRVLATLREETRLLVGNLTAAMEKINEPFQDMLDREPEETPPE